MRSFLVIAGLTAVLLTACSSQPPAPEQKPASVEDRQPGTADSMPIKSESVDPYSIAALKDPNSPLSKRNVFFDFDSFIVKDEFKSLLEQQGKFLAANPKIKSLIQGNADERGVVVKNAVHLIAAGDTIALFDGEMGYLGSAKVARRDPAQRLELHGVSQRSQGL